MSDINANVREDAVKTESDIRAGGIDRGQLWQASDTRKLIRRTPIQLPDGYWDVLTDAGLVLMEDGSTVQDAIDAIDPNQWTVVSNADHINPFEFMLSDHDGETGITLPSDPTIGDEYRMYEISGVNSPVYTSGQTINNGSEFHVDGGNYARITYTGDNNFTAVLIIANPASVDDVDYAVSGKLDSVVAGVSITVDNTDANNPIISSTDTTYTDAEIKQKYEANSNTNAFTDAEKTNLANQSGTNTGDQAMDTVVIGNVVGVNINNLVGAKNGEFGSVTGTDSRSVIGVSIGDGKMATSGLVPLIVQNRTGADLDFSIGQQVYFNYSLYGYGMIQDSISVNRGLVEGGGADFIGVIAETTTGNPLANLQSRAVKIFLQLDRSIMKTQAVLNYAPETTQTGAENANAGGSGLVSWGGIEDSRANDDAPTFNIPTLKYGAQSDPTTGSLGRYMSLKLDSGTIVNYARFSIVCDFMSYSPATPSFFKIAVGVYNHPNGFYAATAQIILGTGSFLVTITRKTNGDVIIQISKTDGTDALRNYIVWNSMVGMNYSTAANLSLIENGVNGYVTSTDETVSDVTWTGSITATA